MTIEDDIRTFNERAAKVVTVSSILQEASEAVGGPRRDDYGHPIEDFTRTGRMWAAILGVDEVTPEQVALCMVAVKISREVHRPKRDNLVDIAGYAATLKMVREAQSKRTARLPPPYIVERCPSCDEELSRTGGPREVQDAED